MTRYDHVPWRVDYLRQFFFDVQRTLNLNTRSIYGARFASSEDALVRESVECLNRQLVPIFS